MPPPPNADPTSDHINAWWLGTAEAGEAGSGIQLGTIAANLGSRRDRRAGDVE